MQVTDLTASPQNTNAIRRRRSPRDASIIELCDRINRLERKYIRICSKCHSIAEEDAARPELERVQAQQDKQIAILGDRKITSMLEARTVAATALGCTGLPPLIATNEDFDLLYYNIAIFLATVPAENQ